jgi:type IV secretory pathway VirB4 component
MLAATAWLSAVLQRNWDRRVIQIIDEAWAAVRHGARHFQASLKLARTYGVSTWLICHRPADLTAQSDDGTADAKIAAGLLSDVQTRIILRQPADQVSVAAELLGLSERETQIIGQLVRGRALWRLQHRGAVVHNVLTATETQLFDTDAAMHT